MFFYSLIVAAVLALWVFTCLWVAIPLRTVDETSWHSRMIFRKPEGNCAYFWTLLISPIVNIYLLANIAIWITVLIVYRFLFDWLIMPICGRRVEHPTTRKYWKEFLVRMDDRVCHYVEFRYRNYWIGLVVLLASIAWISVAGVIFFQLTNASAQKKDGLIMALIPWSIFTLLVLYGVLQTYFTDSKKLHDFREGFGFISGKLCRKLEYEKSETNSN
jgi:hypothetical protein